MKIELGQWKLDTYVLMDTDFISFCSKKSKDQPKILKILAEQLSEYYDGQVQWLKHEDGYIYIVIVLYSNLFETSRYKQISTCYHEAVHAAQTIYNHFGESRPGTECQAYLIEHIGTECLKFLDTKIAKKENAAE